MKPSMVGPATAPSQETEFVTDESFASLVKEEHGHCVGWIEYC